MVLPKCSYNGGMNHSIMVLMEEWIRAMIALLFRMGWHRVFKKINEWMKIPNYSYNGRIYHTVFITFLFISIWFFSCLSFLILAFCSKLILLTALSIFFPKEKQNIPKEVYFLMLIFLIRHKHVLPLLLLWRKKTKYSVANHRTINIVVDSVTDSDRIFFLFQV